VGGTGDELSFVPSCSCPPGSGGREREREREGEGEASERERERIFIDNHKVTEGRSAQLGDTKRKRERERAR
jgi:hypothetical protein